MKLLLFEPNYTGHHLYYIRIILEALGQCAADAVLCLDRVALESKEFSVHLAAVRGQCQLDANFGPVPCQTWASALARCRMLRAAIKRHKPDTVLVPFADGGLSQVAGLARMLGFSPVPKGVAAHVIVMRGGWAYPSRNWREWLFYRASLKALEWAAWTRIHFIDFIPYEYLAHTRNPLAARSTLIPDPVEAPPLISQGEARRALGIPMKSRCVACCGLLDERKGVDLLLRAFVKASLEPNDLLLLAGTVSAGVRAVLERDAKHLYEKGAIIVLDRCVSESELWLSILAADLVCTPYPRHIGSASIVLRAAMANRPVLGSPFGWVGETIRRYGLGWCANVEDPVAFAGALVRSLSASRANSTPQPSARVASLCSVERFQAAILQTLSETERRP